MGNTDIPSELGTTVTGAIRKLRTNQYKYRKVITVPASSYISVDISDDIKKYNNNSLNIKGFDAYPDYAGHYYWLTVKDKFIGAKVGFYVVNEGTSDESNEFYITVFI